MVLERQSIRAFVEESPDSPAIRVARMDPLDFSTEAAKPPRPDAHAEDVDFDLVVEVKGPAKRARLLIEAKRRYRDGHTVLVVAQTKDELAEFRFAIDQTHSRPFLFHMSTADLSGTDPENAWPLLNFLSLAKAPNEFSVSVPGRPPRWNPVPLVEAPVDSTLATLVLQLRTVARRTSTPLRVPSTFSGSLSHSLGVAAQLLAGAVVSGHWRSAEVVMGSDFPFAVTDGDLFRVDLHVPLQFAVDSVMVSVDRWARLHRVRFSKSDTTSEGHAFRLEPADDGSVDFRRGPWLSTEERQESAEAVMVGDWVALVGDAVVCSAARLDELRVALEELNLHPDKIVRALGSDIPSLT